MGTLHWAEVSRDIHTTTPATLSRTYHERDVFHDTAIHRDSRRLPEGQVHTGLQQSIQRHGLQPSGLGEREVQQPQVLAAEAGPADGLRQTGRAVFETWHFEINTNCEKK